MDVKKSAGLVILLLLLSSYFVLAEEESTSSCAGFFGSISCFLWGNPDNWVGQSWFDRGAK